MTVEQRFLNKVSKADCWEWQAAKDRDGYGLFLYEGKSTLAHRVAYMLFKGELKRGMHTDHLCRNVACVNPEHLEQVTPKENVNRGKGARKTMCINGHLFDEDNTYVWVNRAGNEQKTCRACNRLHKRKYK